MPQNHLQLEKRREAWLAENMKSYTLIFSKKLILTLFASFTMILYPIGIWLYTNNQHVNEVVINYTSCINAPSNFTINSSDDNIKEWKFDNATSTCTMKIAVKEKIQNRVNFYIRITNFYQNHRLYVKSLDVEQLKGKLYKTAGDIPVSTSLTNCGYLLHANCDVQKTFTYNENGLTFAENNEDCRGEIPELIRNSNTTSQYYPCGLIANSMFTDDISSLTCLEGECLSNPSLYSRYTFTESGISWFEDVDLYRKSSWATTLPFNETINANLIPPPRWRKAWPEIWGNGYNSSNLPDLQSWERFHVWMRKSALPTFRKLWGLTDVPLETGIYQLSIKDTWDCRRFGGTKSIIFSEVGVLGIRNSFLPYLFLGTASFCLLSVILVLILTKRKLGTLDSMSFRFKQE